MWQHFAFLIHICRGDGCKLEISKTEYFENVCKELAACSFNPIIVFRGQNIASGKPILQGQSHSCVRAGRLVLVQINWACLDG